MVTVSNAFRDRIYYGQNYSYFADVTFENGDEIQFNDDNFKVGGCNFEYGGGSSDIALGVAIAKHLKFSILNPNGEYDDYDFVNAEIELYMKMQMEDGKIETVQFGTFYVSQPATYGITVDVEAYDAMVKAGEVVFEPGTISYTVGTVLSEACTQAGLILRTTGTINNSTLAVTVPEGLTCREVIGYAAMLAGGNAFIDVYGYVYVKSYNIDVLDDIEEEKDIDFYSHDYNVFNDYADLTVGKDEIQITGVRIVIDNVPYNSGTSGYMIEVENELISGTVQEIMAQIGAIGSVLIGLTFKTFSMKQIRYPIAEPGDPVLILPINGGMIKSFITDITYDFDNYTEIECNAADPMRNASQTYNSPTVRAIVEARKSIVAEKNARILAQEALERQIASMSGLYETTEIQQDQSVIYYFHDKPTIAESTLVIKIGSEAIGISLDGGTTWPYGLSFYDATAILNSIYTVGLDATYITAGILKSRENPTNPKVYIDLDNGIFKGNFTELSISGNAAATQSYADGKANDAQAAAEATAASDATSKANAAEANAVATAGTNTTNAIASYNTSLDQTAVFNKLTNNQANQGLYLQNGQLYVNAAMIMAGILSGREINNGNGTFRVTEAGALTATSATITGTVNMTNGRINVQTNDQEYDYIILDHTKSKTYISSNMLNVENKSTATNPYLKTSIQGGGIFMSNTNTSKNLVYIGTASGYGLIALYNSSGTQKIGISGDAGNIYATTFYGALSGNATSADSATNATYATSAGSATSATTWTGWSNWQPAVSNAQTDGYIRFPNNGSHLQIAWKRVTWTGAINQAWGSGVYESASVISLGNWKAAFGATPAVAYGCHSANGYSAWVCSGQANATGSTTSNVTSTSAGTVYLERGGSTLASTTWYIMVIAIGWYT